jgi:SulP family sulfate permease
MVRFRRVQSYFNLSFRSDLSAGLTVALIAIPQSMAYALICGINPIYGLIGVIIPTVIAALLGDSSFLVSGFTNAVAMATAGVLSSYTGEAGYLQLVFLIAIISGLLKLLLGAFKLGWITRFISNSVLTGFLMGLGLLIIINQLGSITGIPRPFNANPIQTLLSLVQGWRSFNGYVFITGLVCLALLFLIRKLNEKLPAEMIVIAVASLAVYLFGWSDKGVMVVSDLGPMPVLGVVLHLPQVPLEDWQFYLTSGLAVALLSIMEALSVSKSVALARGEKLNISKELVGQGIASIIGGLFQSPPASGSPSRTAVSLSAGTRTRFGAVFSGLWVIPVVLLLPKLLGYIPLPGLAAVVITSATRIVNWKHVHLTWFSKGTSKMVLLVTFGATLIFPLQDAIFMGAVLSLLIYLFESSQLKLTYFEMDEERRFYQYDTMRRLRPDLPIVLISPEGPLHFAAVDELEKHLGEALESGAEVVILRLRRAQVVASSAITILAAEILHAEKLGKKVILCGVDKSLHQHLLDSGVLDLLGEEYTFDSERLLFSSTRSAVRQAEDFLAEKHKLEKND